MLAIETENLTKQYKDTLAVDTLNIKVKENEVFALLGVNGAGKTTTIKMLSCLIKPTSGNAYLYGYSILDNPEKVKKIIDISMQETAIARNLTVKENLYFYANIIGIKKQEIDIKIKEIVNIFSLNTVLNKKTKNLSGGWQRKLSIALAILGKPKILFLDEPTLGLDVIARRELWSLIEQLKKNMTVILTTHYLEEAEALADRIGIMKNGKLLAEDSCKNIKKKTKKNNFEEAFISVIEKGGF